MTKLFESATKIVLLLLSIGAIVLTFMWVMDAKDFYQAWTLVLAFYFWQKVNVPSREEIELQKLNKQ